MKRYFFLVSCIIMLTACESINDTEKKVLDKTITKNAKTAESVSEPVKSKIQDGGWMHYKCSNNAEFISRSVDSDQQSIDIRLNGSDIVNRLTRIGKEAGIYSDGYVSVHVKDNYLSVYQGGSSNIGNNCAAQ